MARFSAPDPDRLTAGQRDVADQVRRGRRGTVPANVLAWLPSPELARRAAHLGEFIRYETSLPARLSELAILVVARRWNCQYEWAIHTGEAAKAGVAPAIIAVIGTGGTPGLGVTAEQVVFDVATELVAGGMLADHTFEQAGAALGRQALVELIGLVGYYTMVAMTLNAFEMPVPAGAPTLP
jgi:4-carboxymuconolactone decarboxylase